MLEAVNSTSTESICDAFNSGDGNRILLGAIYISRLNIEEIPFSEIRPLIDALAHGCQTAFSYQCKEFNRENLYILDNMYKLYYDLKDYGNKLGVI